MKKFNLILALSLVSLFSRSTPLGLGSFVSGEYAIKFFEGKLEDGLKQAGKSKKLVFVDAYTSWCGPCKMMSSRTFTDAKVGEYFNEHFVSMKIDMEKGEGPQVAMKYSVRAYPTLLFLNSKGEVVHTVLGYRDATQLIEDGKKAVSLKK